MMRKTALLFILVLVCLGTPLPSRAQESYTLEDLLRIGREQNPTLLALRAEQAGLKARRTDAGRLANPELEYSAGRGDPFESPESKSARELSVSQVIENPLSRAHRLGALRAGVDAAAERVRAGILDVEAEIRLHVYRVLFLEERLRLARLNEEALNEIRSLIEARASVGEVRELEAIRLRVEHMRATNEVRATEVELDQFRRHLNTFLGNALPDDYVLVGELTSDLRVPDLARLTEEILLSHPALREASLDREAAEEEWKARRIGWLPDPVVSAASGRELDGDLFRIGIGFQIPLWNQSRAATEEGRQLLAETTYREDGLRLELQAQLMIHHNQLQLFAQTLRLFQEGLLEEADTSMEIADASYRAGEISFVEYLDAQRTYQSIQIEYQQALYDWNRELAELDRAAGGGIL